MNVYNKHMLNNNPKRSKVGAFACAHTCIISFSAHGRHRINIDTKSYCIV